MTIPVRTKIKNRVDYALQNTPSPNLVLAPRPSAYRCQALVSLHSHNQLSVLYSFPPLPSILATFSQTVSATSKTSTSKTLTSSSKSNRMSYSPPPTPSPSLITQTSKLLHTSKLKQPKLFALKADFDHIKSPKALS